MEKSNKNKLIIFIKSGFSWLLAVIIGLAVSSAFVFIYNYSGTHIPNQTGATDYKWNQNQYQATMVEGNAIIHMDDYGFHNTVKPDKVDILLMGASHMEAVMIPTGRETGSLLNSKLDSLKTYNIGISGHELLVCLDNLEAAIKYYQPQKYIIIHSGNLSFTDKTLEEALNHKLKDIPSYNSGILFWLQKVPAIKVIYKQFEDKSRIDLKSSQFFLPSKKSESVTDNNNTTDDVNYEYGWDNALLVSLLNEKSKLCKEQEIKLIFAYTPNVDVDKDSNELIRTDTDGLSEYMQAVCDETGIVFVDLFEDFKEAYDKECAFPFGFSNTKPFVGHLNEEGHEMLADRLADTINTMEDNK